MHAGKKNGHTQKQNPVYIGYFTAWQDTDGILHFMIFIIEMKLAGLLFDPK
jgi:murein L,D-transpeptidase YcbB/YkuD